MPDMEFDVRIAGEALDSIEAQRLIELLNAELLARYPEEGATHFDLTAEEVSPGRGAFLLACRGDEAVGCGAVRLIDESTAELKRMFIIPLARGRGLSKRLLEALEAKAMSLGATKVVLETGERQLEALGLYTSAGYQPIEAFGAYVDSPLSICMAKTLPHKGCRFDIGVEI
jgi:putative acetyltransferase